MQAKKAKAIELEKGVSFFLSCSFYLDGSYFISFALVATCQQQQQHRHRLLQVAPNLAPALCALRTSQAYRYLYSYSTYELYSSTACLLKENLANMRCDPVWNRARALQFTAKREFLSPLLIYWFTRFLWHLYQHPLFITARIAELFFGY